MKTELLFFAVIALIVFSLASYHYGRSTMREEIRTTLSQNVNNGKRPFAVAGYRFYPFTHGFIQEERHGR